jgi:hypothetical protein
MLALAGVTPSAAAQGCTLSAGASIAFGAFLPLSSTGDVISHSAGSLALRCDAGVSVSLRASSPRVLVGASGSIGFRLSLAPGAAADDLPSASPGAPLTAIADTWQGVPIHARIPMLEHVGKPTGHYAASIILTLDY